MSVFWIRIWIPGKVLLSVIKMKENCKYTNVRRSSNTLILNLSTVPLKTRNRNKLKLGLILIKLTCYYSYTASSSRTEEHRATEIGPPDHLAQSSQAEQNLHTTRER